MATKLEPGMLLLSPGEGLNPRPQIYTVVSDKTLIAFHGSCSERATLRRPGLPEGWRVINNAPLARALADGAITDKKETDDGRA